jgi:DNA mismatch endonuclease (patch repair protein)
MDPFNAEKRSKIMSHIRGKDTGVEKRVRSLLHSLGYRFRVHVDGLPKYASIVFVHGCFWHGHEGCKRASIPRTNSEFWTRKITGNVQRDRRAVRELHNLGWKVLTIWQCETRNLPVLENRIAKFFGKDEH